MSVGKLVKGELSLSLSGRDWLELTSAGAGEWALKIIRGDKEDIDHDLDNEQVRALQEFIDYHRGAR